MRVGGHDALDPISALAFCAAATTTLRLTTYLLIAPYRNHLLAAKCAATVDVLSTSSSQKNDRLWDRFPMTKFATPRIAAGHG